MYLEPTPLDWIVMIGLIIGVSIGLFFAAKSEAKKKKIEATKKEGYHTPEPIK